MRRHRVSPDQQPAGQSAAATAKTKLERGRPRTACAACARKKVKCSGEVPCALCQKLGVECLPAEARPAKRSRAVAPAVVSASMAEPVPTAAMPLAAAPASAAPVAVAAKLDPLFEPFNDTALNLDPNLMAWAAETARQTSSVCPLAMNMGVYNEAVVLAQQPHQHDEQRMAAHALVHATVALGCVASCDPALAGAAEHSCRRAHDLLAPIAFNASTELTRYTHLTLSSLYCYCNAKGPSALHAEAAGAAFMAVTGSRGESLDALQVLQHAMVDRTAPTLDALEMSRGSPGLRTLKLLCFGMFRIFNPFNKQVEADIDADALGAVRAAAESIPPGRDGWMRLVVLGVRAIACLHAGETALARELSTATLQLGLEDRRRMGLRFTRWVLCVVVNMWAAAPESADQELLALCARTREAIDAVLTTVHAVAARLVPGVQRDAVVWVPAGAGAAAGVVVSPGSEAGDVDMSGAAAAVLTPLPASVAAAAAALEAQLQPRQPPADDRPLEMTAQLHELLNRGAMCMEWMPVLCAQEHGEALQLAQSYPPSASTSARAAHALVHAFAALGALCMCRDDMRDTAVALHGRSRELLAPVAFTLDRFVGHTHMAMFILSCCCKAYADVPVHSSLGVRVFELMAALDTSATTALLTDHTEDEFLVAGRHLSHTILSAPNFVKRFADGENMDMRPPTKSDAEMRSGSPGMRTFLICIELFSRFVHSSGRGLLQPSAEEVARVSRLLEQDPPESHGPIKHVLEGARAVVLVMQQRFPEAARKTNALLRGMLEDSSRWAVPPLQVLLTALVSVWKTRDDVPETTAELLARAERELTPVIGQFICVATALYPRGHPLRPPWETLEEVPTPSPAELMDMEFEDVLLNLMF